MASLRALRPLTSASFSARPRATSALRLPHDSAFSSSSPRLNTTPHLPPGVTHDPSHPHLYYHAVPTQEPKFIALSFLPSRPTPKTVIGTLPAIPEAGLSDFSENPAFLKTLHDGIREGLEKGADARLSYEAEMRPGDGYMTITDERAVPPQGRIGETEDLIGSVFVENGKIIASTYEPLPSYRLVTPNGVCTLPEGLDKAVVELIQKIDAEELAE